MRDDASHHLSSPCTQYRGLYVLIFISSPHLLLLVGSCQGQLVREAFETSVDTTYILHELARKMAGLMERILPKALAGK